MIIAHVLYAGANPRTQVRITADRQLGMSRAQEYSPPLDQGIAHAVEVLRAAGVETFESCQGGSGHAYPEPTVRFHGEQPEGYRALAAALYAGLRVAELRRVWPVQRGELTGPWWELTFAFTASHVVRR